MNNSCYADISFFNAVGQNAGGGFFVWNGNTPGTALADPGQETEQKQKKNSPSSKKESSSDKSTEPAPDKQSNTQSGDFLGTVGEKMKAGLVRQGKLRKTLGATALAFLLGSCALQYNIAEKADPVAFADRFANNTPAMNVVDAYNHPHYYTKAMVKHPSLEWAELFRRSLELELASAAGLSLGEVFRKRKRKKTEKAVEDYGQNGNIRVLLDALTQDQLLPLYALAENNPKIREELDRQLKPVIPNESLRSRVVKGTIKVAKQLQERFRNTFGKSPVSEPAQQTSVAPAVLDTSIKGKTPRKAKAVAKKK